MAKSTESEIGVRWPYQLLLLGILLSLVFFVDAFLFKSDFAVKERVLLETDAVKSHSMIAEVPDSLFTAEHVREVVFEGEVDLTRPYLMRWFPDAAELNFFRKVAAENGTANSFLERSTPQTPFYTREPKIFSYETGGKQKKLLIFESESGDRSCYDCPAFLSVAVFIREGNAWKPELIQKYIDEGHLYTHQVDGVISRGERISHSSEAVYLGAENPFVVNFEFNNPDSLSLYEVGNGGVRRVLYLPNVEFDFYDIYAGQTDDPMYGHKSYVEPVMGANNGVYDIRVRVSGVEPVGPQLPPEEVRVFKYEEYYVYKDGRYVKIAEDKVVSEPLPAFRFGKNYTYCHNSSEYPIKVVKGESNFAVSPSCENDPEILEEVPEPAG